MKEEKNSKKKYIIDASIIIKWLVREQEDFHFAINLLNDFYNKKVHLLIPIFVHWEVNNFLGRSLAFGTAVEKYSHFKLLKLEESHLSMNTTLKAFAIMKKFHKVSFYDASYHALAIENGGIFLTADKKYYDKTRRIGSIMLLENYK